MKSMLNTRTMMKYVGVAMIAMALGSCSPNWVQQKPELGDSQSSLEQRFTGIEKSDLAWTFPSHEWAREGSWEVHFDGQGKVNEAIWHAKPNSKGMTYASYIHILTRTMKEMGDGSNDTPTGETYQVWRKKEARYVLNLSADSSSLYFQKVAPTGYASK